MTKAKKKWNTFKWLFSKNPRNPSQSTSKNKKSKPQEIFVIEPAQEETFVVDSESNDVLVIEPTQRETFVLKSSEETTHNFKSKSNEIFVTEPTKEYELLGLSVNATDAELKKRYRSLMKQIHPDRGGDAKEFMKIRKAYLKIMQTRAEVES